MIVCVMPAFNESEGIQTFIEEISQSCQSYISRFVVIDDCSTDDMEEPLNQLVLSGVPLIVVRNDTNLGHGPSTILALRHGLEQNMDLVLAVDGDGQFFGSDILQVINTMLESGCDIVEANRQQRSDEPWFRKLASWTTRYLVFLKSKSMPIDANTPLRLYKADVLRTLLLSVPVDSRIPNLNISILSRQNSIRICYTDVKFRSRLGAVATGTTWGNSRRFFPTRRFMTFCWGALSDYLEIGFRRP